MNWQDGGTMSGFDRITFDPNVMGGRAGRWPPAAPCSAPRCGPTPPTHSAPRPSARSPQKWMNFYTRVLARFATQPGLKLTLRFEVAEDVSLQQADETRLALRESGLDESALQVVEE
jgi:hypothetical protein